MSDSSHKIILQGNQYSTTSNTAPSISYTANTYKEHTFLKMTDIPLIVSSNSVLLIHAGGGNAAPVAASFLKNGSTLSTAASPSSRTPCQMTYTSTTGVGRMVSYLHAPGSVTPARYSVGYVHTATTSLTQNTWTSTNYIGQECLIIIEV